MRLPDFWLRLQDFSIGLRKLILSEVLIVDKHHLRHKEVSKIVFSNKIKFESQGSLIEFELFHLRLTNLPKSLV